MDIKKYGKREKRIVEQVGIARMWECNQLVIAIIDKHGIEAGEAILEDLQRHAVDTAKLHIQVLESEKAL
ncbi:hypothetical protein CN980_32940 [Bacillus cereus]|uniref:Uncharacterized protein n=2 Tax=Bacillus cereus group TaxID=86661 RepID=A0A9X6LKD8_BACTU|nr:MULTISPECIES: hypothetical protein [Bacillus cereus group]OUB45304.1 hypothetical protein BK741_21275 [Bacillus thuringiensis serovar iberica]OUB45326.1 hypothetical protein BK741_21245 [Bacillus thuringiensis serovar iberica]OUB48457.1 hypothetical protein BK741_13700 [Bacillus thuringiensis serovar iberica]OUB51999.1 hypothetical protein BK741_07245 [Bacillus thuringiensis serovar iberica]PGO53725.1 hypothetical protein CN980_32940 [Bacillus cereus]